MAILLMDGFELGTTLAQANLLNGTAYASGTGVNTTSTITYGASTSGAISARSIKMGIIATAASGTTNIVTFGQAVTNFMGSSGATGYQFAYGFRGRLNSSKTSALTNATGLSASDGSGANVLLRSTTALNAVSSSAPASIDILFGSTVIGSFLVSDYNWHYYSVAAQKVGTNLWNIQVYLDKVKVFNGLSLSATLSDTPYWFFSIGTPQSTTVQHNAFSEFDDFYIVGADNPLGDIVVYRTPGTADVTAQWKRFGGSASDAVATDRIDSSITTTGVQSSVSGAADLYSIADPSTILARRRIYAAKSTLFGTGDGTTLVKPTLNSGNANPVTGAGAALSVFGGVSDTGWDSTLANTALANFQFGVSRS